MKRIQRKRTKDWRMPDNTVYVGRSSKLGNPFIVLWGCVCFEMRNHNTMPGVYLATRKLYGVLDLPKKEQQKEVVKCYRQWLLHGHDFLKQFKSLEFTPECIEPPPTKEEIRQFINGRDVACWCGLDKPCHADILLEICNADWRNDELLA